MNTDAEAQRTDLEQRIAQYLQRYDEDDAPSRTVTVEGRAGEGDSLENWFFIVTGEQYEQRWVLRRNGLTVATESDRRREYEVLVRLQGSGLPVPRVGWLDATGEHLGRPGFAMERCEGTADLLALSPANRFGWDDATRVELAQKFVKLMAQIHRVDWRGLGLGEVLELPKTSAAEMRLQTILGEIERYRREPYPEIDEVVDWLECRMPPPGQVVLTHGDFRVVQALLDPQAQIQAMLDWEFVRLSDPLEELAHYMMPLMAPLHTIPGVWDVEELIGEYEAATGTRVDRTELVWWRVLNMLWVVSFLLRTVDGIIENTIDGVRSHAFVSRLLGILLSLTRSRAGEEPRTEKS
jgi:aminoglycoside phosphotransferase (APT) family kinase protein